VNPDPRSLWQDIPCDPTAPYFKDSTATRFQKLGDRNLVMASRRGRSHANTGGFREDDFAVASSQPSGWHILAIADGAGSAAYAREGSRLAVNTAVEKVAEQIRTTAWETLEGALSAHAYSTGKPTLEVLQQQVYEQLREVPQQVFKTIEAEAISAGKPLGDFNSTLVFTLFKKHPFGTVFLTFGVGDCPAVVLYNGSTEARLLNKLDTGDFGGGTRFITMPGVLKEADFRSRFSCHIFPNFDKLVLMTDGIYDAKFPSEAALTQPDSWARFWTDLAGENEDGHKVDFLPENTSAGEQLLTWTQFWSTGNHDDRTLAIVF
jgi:serine/threonine protein phosphatase PrpC